MNNWKLNHYYVIAALLVVGLALVTACGGQTADALEEQSNDAMPLTEEALKNAEYRSEWTEDGAAQLVNGEYRKPIMEGSATEIVIRLVGVAFGDLNGDGAKDAAVILVTDPGGSGTFYDLVAVLNRDGEPEHVATVSLGDRAEIQTLSVESGQIIVRMITHGPNDPMCCPTQEVEQTYALQGSKLVDIASQVLSSGTAEGASITGITWQWTELVESAPAAQSVVPNPEDYTLLLQPDGTLSIKADCNGVGGSYTLEGDFLTIALGPSTMAYCGEQSLDHQYLGLLDSVDSYAVQDGRLVLSLQNGTGRMTLDQE
jgi:heat shock protein HslJ